MQTKWSLNNESNKLCAHACLSLIRRGILQFCWLKVWCELHCMSLIVYLFFSLSLCTQMRQQMRRRFLIWLTVIFKTFTRIKWIELHWSQQQQCNTWFRWHNNMTQFCCSYHRHQNRHREYFYNNNWRSHVFI